MRPHERKTLHYTEDCMYTYTFVNYPKVVSMFTKYHNHKPQTTPWHREEEPLNHQEHQEDHKAKQPACSFRY